MSIPSQDHWTDTERNTRIALPRPNGGDDNAAVMLSIVIPMFNEADHLEKSLKEISYHVASLGTSYELIVVDDGSSDSTWELLHGLCREIPQLRCLALSRNFGKESAVLAGIEAARGNGVIIMDGDLQHPPNLIPEMYAVWQQQGYQVVNAIKRRRGKESLTSKLGSRLFYRLFEKLTGTQMAGSSDFKLLDREVVDAYIALRERNLFFRGLIPWLGFSQIDLPFEVKPRAGGRSKWSVLQLSFMAVNSIVSFSAVPLRLVTLSGLFFMLFAIGLAAQTLYVKLSGGAVEGFTTVIMLVLFASSILMLSLGVIGEYLAKIYDEIKQRPRYLLKEATGANDQRVASSSGQRNQVVHRPQQ
ncbi:MAG: glycosyltransferase family 2 protein [Pirellulales bacterium]